MIATQPAAASAALLLGSLGVVLLLRGRRRLVGTTLLGPWAWSLGALLLVVGGEAALLLVKAGSEPAWVEPLRFAAAMSTFCPFIALLGAKRPQNGPWQFVVLTLWILLALPSAVNLMVRYGQRLHVEPLWSWFVLVLLAMAVVNYLPTRHWLSALLAAAGQTLLLAEQLPFAAWFAARNRPTLGLLLLVMAIALASAGIGPAARTPRAIDRLWRDFRNSYGVVWGLRVAERIRECSTRHDWNLAVTWNGVSQQADGRELSEETAEAVAGNLRSVLLRFVSPAWIAERLGTP